MKSIIMSGDSVRAILGGAKTQTRVPIVPQPEEHYWPVKNHRAGDNDWIFLEEGVGGTRIEHRFSSKHQVGDVLYVKETHCVVSNGDEPLVLYRATGDGPVNKWRNAMLMPIWAARIFLRITDVRVERVQDIRASDAVAEGVNPTGTDACDIADSAKSRYAELWDSINAKRGYPWAENPWVYVYTFKRITKDKASNQDAK